MKFNDETDADYMVRMLRDNFNARAKEEAEAMIRREEAFAVLMIAEKVKAYLEKHAEAYLGKQAEKAGK
jgi:hypothetical protein